MGFLRAERDYLGYRTGKNSTLYNIVGGLGYFRDDVVSFFSPDPDPYAKMNNQGSLAKDILQSGVALGAIAGSGYAWTKESLVNSFINKGQQLVGAVHNAALSFKKTDVGQSIEMASQTFPDLSDNPIALTTSAVAALAASIAIGRAEIHRKVDLMVNEHGALSSNFNDQYHDDYEPEGYDGRAIDAQLDRSARIIREYNEGQDFLEQGWQGVDTSADQLEEGIGSLQKDIELQIAEQQESNKTPLELVQKSATELLEAEETFEGEATWSMDDIDILQKEFSSHMGVKGVWGDREMNDIVREAKPEPANDSFTSAELEIIFTEIGLREQARQTFENAITDLGDAAPKERRYLNKGLNLQPTPVAA